MPTRRDARRNLDNRFRNLGLLAKESRPHKGWIRAVRDALGMSREELGDRLDISQQAVAEIEASEMRESIRLETLRRIADALECDLAYFILPRRGLEEMVRDQAMNRARSFLEGVAHNSRLEDQQVEESRVLDQLQEIADRYVDRRGLWSDDYSDR